MPHAFRLLVAHGFELHLQAVCFSLELLDLDFLSVDSELGLLCVLVVRHGFKLLLGVVFGISFIAFASSIVNSVFSFSGAVI